MRNNLENEGQNSKQLMIRRGFMIGLPIILGYLPVAITFGVVASQSEFTLGQIGSMSMFVYAGASQFMGVNMIAVGAGTVEIIIATFVLNFRHFVMSFSFMNQLRRFSFIERLPLSLTLTDETFAVASIHNEHAKEKNGTYFYLIIFITAYVTWILGSLLGGVLGEILPEQVSDSMGIALYALFIGLLIPSVKREWRVGMIALVAILINVLCSSFLSTGWSVIMGTIVGGLSGLYFLKEDEVT